MSGPVEPDIGPVDPADAPRNRAGGMVVLTGANALYIASAYVITVWLAHDLGPRDFGRYGVATAVVTLITIVVTRGVPVSATREIAADPVRARGTMLVAGRVMIPLALGITALGALAAYPVSQILRDDKLFVPLLIGSAAAITYAAQALPLAWFTGMHDYARQTAAQSWYAVSRLGAIIVGALLAGLAGAMAGFVIAPLIAALATLGACNSCGGIAVDRRPRRPRLRP